MPSHPQIAKVFKQELTDWQRWAGRMLVLVFAATTGLVIVVFTWLTEQSLHCFQSLYAWRWWAPLLITPACTGAIVWLTGKWFPGIAGSGIPQVIAALETDLTDASRSLFVSLKLSVAKVFLTAGGLLAGLSIGREGPSVQIASGIMHHARRWIPAQAGVSDQSLLIAGGAAGIAAAFNTPLGGIMFAIEELTRRPEQRNNSLILAAIVLSGLVAVSVYGNASYFGVIRVDSLALSLIAPALWVAILSGVTGGFFSRLMVASAAGTFGAGLARLRARRPVVFAVFCGVLIALIGVGSSGATFGSGYSHTRALLENGTDPFLGYFSWKFAATWLSTWSGVPGGIFAPSLAIGGSLGYDVAHLTGYANAPTLIALGMAGFLAAVTQAPLTAFIIVMEMVDGHALVLSLMTCAMLAGGISRLISAPLYSSLAQLQLKRIGAVRPK